MLRRNGDRVTSGCFRFCSALLALVFCGVLLACQPAFGNYSNLTVGCQGPFGDPAYYKVGTHAMLEGLNENSGQDHVSSIYVKRDDYHYVETGWWTTPTYGYVRRLFVAFWNWDKSAHDWVTFDGLAFGEWRYFEINRYQAVGSDWQWRVNCGGWSYRNNYMTFGMDEGTSFSSAERSPGGSNYHASGNVCYKDTNGGWYMFNDLHTATANDSG